MKTTASILASLYCMVKK